ncbi:MAG: substrate-binding domain-containing protein [Chloroflexota bacterium]
MKYLRRAFGVSVAILVLLTTFSPNAALRSNAQDANTVTVDGSNIVSPILKAASQSYSTKNVGAKIEVNVSGTTGGFEKLCAGTLDLNMAVRSITDEEAAACQQKNVKFIETVLGYDALVVVVNASSKVTCLTTDQLNKLLSPSASGVKNWNAIDATLGDLPITAVYAPPPESQVYTLADSLVAGDKIRTDIQKVDTSAQVIEKVSSDGSGVGILTLADANNASNSQQGQTIKRLQLKNGDTCLDATVPNLEEARYPAGETLYLYLNAASLDRKPVSDFMNYLFGSDGRSAITSNGFVSASQTTYDRIQNYLATRQTGRTFSRIQSVNVPADTAGSVVADGSPDVFPILKAVSDAFKPRYDKITVNTTTFGNDIGYRKLCANGVDMIGATRKPSDAEAESCQKANVQTLRLNLGSSAVVLLVNGNNKFATCLTTDEIGKLFGIASQGKIMKWSDVNPAFPATDLLILTPTDGAAETDFLLNKSIKAVAPVRRQDTTENDDALYRGAGTQNVEGAITYMNFADFQKVKANVHPVQVNAGSGCVDPSEANVKSGTYPISEPLYVVLNLTTFTRPEIKAFVWYLLGDDAAAIFAKQGLVGTDTAGIVAARDIALTRFAQAAPSAPAATQQATGVATDSAAPAATLPATTAPTALATLPATTSPTVAVTVKATIAPTTVPPTIAPTSIPPTDAATVASDGTPAK